METIIKEAEEFKPEVGDFVRPEFWDFGDNLIEGDSFSDSSYSGSDFRLLRSYDSIIPSVPVNITITGKTPMRKSGQYWMRCKIEFVQDGEESTFSKGLILYKF